MDNLRTIIKKALDEKILVIRDERGPETVYVKNPPLAVVKQTLAEAHAIKFRRVYRLESMKTYRYGMQYHVRGRSIHVDLRHEIGHNLVTGETITVPFGLPNYSEIKKKIDKATSEVVGSRVKRKEDWKSIGDKEKRRIADILKKRISPNEIKQPIFEKWYPDFLNWNTKKVFLPKATQDESWTQIDWAIFPPGWIGTTTYEWGFMVKFDEGKIQYGVLKPDFYEYWLESKEGCYSGRVNCIWLPREQVQASLNIEDPEEKLGSEIWVGFIFTSRVQRPYMASKRAVEDDYLPPDNRSCLPQEFERLVPRHLRYWEAKSTKKRKKRRDDLVKWADDEIEFYTRSKPTDVPKSLKECFKRRKE